MNSDHDYSLADVLERWREERDATPSNQEIYKQKLLEAFPLELPPADELFFQDIGDHDYALARSMFEGKKWNEVDFDILYHDFANFLPLQDAGVNYYLPAFLAYLYDVKNQANQTVRESFDYRFKYYKTSPKYLKLFAGFTPMQSKLIAMYLVNLANLQNHYDQKAQRALTSYWGNFLLF